MPGLWHFHLIEAKGVGTSKKRTDPFVKIKIDSDRRRKFQTKVIDKTHDPKWDAFDSLEGKYSDQNIVLKVYDYNTLGSNTLLGQRSLPVVEYKSGHTHRLTILLRDDYGGDEGKLGSLEMELCWDAEASIMDKKTDAFSTNRRSLLSRPTHAEQLNAQQEAERAQAVLEAQASENRRLHEEAEANARGQEARIEAAEAKRQADLAEAKRQHDSAETARLQAEIKTQEAAAAAAQIERKRVAAETERLATLAAASEAAAARQRQQDYLAAMSRPLGSGESRPLAEGKLVSIGVSWDGGEWDKDADTWAPMDLDATCFALDAKGGFAGLCYFGALSLFNGAVQHSGDEKEGDEEGDDETISCNLASIPSNVSMLYFVVNSFSGEDFDNVEGACATLYIDGKEMLQMDLSLDSSSANANIICRLARSNKGGWVVKNVGLPHNAPNVGAILPIVQECSRDVHPNVVIGQLPAEISVIKNESIDLGRLGQFRIGLGWEFSGEPIDLDANVVSLTSNFEYQKIYYGNKKSKCGAIEHLGDNRSGHGEGEDESILVDLAKLDSKIEHLCISVTSYKMQTFDLLQDAYCRIVDTTGVSNPKGGGGRSICKYDLSSPEKYTAYLMAVLSRNNGSWTFNAVGLHGNGKSVSKTVKPFKDIVQFGANKSKGREALPNVAAFMR